MPIFVEIREIIMPIFVEIREIIMPIFVEIREIIAKKDAPPRGSASL